MSANDDDGEREEVLSGRCFQGVFVRGEGCSGALGVFRVGFGSRQRTCRSFSATPTGFEIACPAAAIEALRPHMGSGKTATSQEQGEHERCLKYAPKLLWKCGVLSVEIRGVGGWIRMTCV